MYVSQAKDNDNEGVKYYAPTTYIYDLDLRF